MLRKIICIALLGTPFVTIAQQGQEAGSSLHNWSLGLGVAVRTGVYLGQDDKVMPFPVLSYESDRFFLRGAYGGIHLFKNDAFSFSAILSGQFDGLDVEDMEESKLAEFGLSRSQLVDRKLGADAGIEATWHGRLGVFAAQTLTDITGASDAMEAKLNYQYFWRLGRQWTIIPNIGLTWMSDDRANYYYGTLDQEVSRGVANYQPDSMVIPHISLGASYAFTEKWRVTATVSHKFLPSEATNSPLISNEKNNITIAFIGITHRF